MSLVRRKDFETQRLATLLSSLLDSTFCVLHFSIVFYTLCVILYVILYVLWCLVCSVYVVSFPHVSRDILKSFPGWCSSWTLLEYVRVCTSARAPAKIKGIREASRQAQRKRNKRARACESGVCSVRQMPASSSAASSEAAVGTALRVVLTRGDSNGGRSGEMCGDSASSSSLHSLAGGATKRALLADVQFEEGGPYQSTNVGNFLEGCKATDYLVVLRSNNGEVSKPKDYNEEAEDDDDDLATAASGSGSDCSCGSPGCSSSCGSRKPPDTSYELYPASRVRLGWRPNNCGRKGCASTGPQYCGCVVRTNWNIGCGMQNMGNTCYMNSILQALFHVPAFVNWLRWDEDEEGHASSESGCGCIICAMRRTLIESQANGSHSFRPHLIYEKLRMISRTFLPGEQEDAHEFLRYLIESMEKAYLRRHRRRFDDLRGAAMATNGDETTPTRIEETTPLNRIFGGYLRTAVTCLRCGHVSRTNRHYFEDLLLDVVRPKTQATTSSATAAQNGGTSSVEEAMDSFFGVEKLEVAGVGDSSSAYRCEGCGRKVPATKQFSIEQPPPVLCVQLKRFSSTSCKYTRHVSFRMRLDATPYIVNSRRRHRANVPLLYRLCAVVTHVGPTVGCGHYTCVARAPNGTFYLFDDSIVRPISHQAVLQTNAYIIMYELESPQVSAAIPKISNGIPNGVLKPELPKLSFNIKTEKRKLDGSEPQKIKPEPEKRHMPKLGKNPEQEPNKLQTNSESNSDSQFNAKRARLEHRTASIFDPQTESVPNGDQDGESVESTPSLSSLSSPEHMSPKKSSIEPSDTQKTPNSGDIEPVSKLSNRSSTKYTPKNGESKLAEMASKANQQGNHNTAGTLKTTKNPGDFDKIVANGNDQKRRIHKFAGIDSKSLELSPKSTMSLVPYDSDNTSSNDSLNEEDKLKLKNRKVEIKNGQNGIKNCEFGAQYPEFVDKNGYGFKNQNRNGPQNSRFATQTNHSSAKNRNGEFEGNGNQKSLGDKFKNGFKDSRQSQRFSNGEIHEKTANNSTHPVKNHNNPETTVENGPQNHDSTKFTGKNRTFAENRQKTYNGSSLAVPQPDPSSSGQVLSKLLKMSHGGYSTPISSWSDTRSKLDKEVSEEKRKERTDGRRSEDRDERRKYPKQNKGGDYAGGRSNPGYNPVQEYHTNQNRNHHRDNQGGHRVFKRHHHNNNRRHFRRHHGNRHFSKNFKGNGKSKFHYNRQ